MFIGGLWQSEKKQKQKKEEEEDWITGNGSSNAYAYEGIPATPVFTRVQQQLMRQGRENGNSHHKYFIIGNAYSPISPYKQGLCRTHPINLYEIYTKTF